jgi:hypothetical protein
VQEAPPTVEVPPDERFGAGMDRWEPGSDFESKTVSRSQRSRRAGGAANSAVQDPQMQASDSRKSGTASADGAAVAGPAASEGLADRLEMRLCSIFLCCLELVSRRFVVALCGSSSLGRDAVHSPCRLARSFTVV